MSGTRSTRGAVPVPGSGLPDANLPETAGGLEADRPWLVACSTGYRSTVAASVLRRAGIRDVANLLGGMSAWEGAGLPVERDARGGGGAHK